MRINIFFINLAQHRKLIALQMTDGFLCSRTVVCLSEDDVIVSATASFGLVKEPMDDADDLDCKDCFFLYQKVI